MYHLFRDIISTAEVMCEFLRSEFVTKGVFTEASLQRICHEKITDNDVCCHIVCKILTKAFREMLFEEIRKNK
jgi:hypothetical protein